MEILVLFAVFAVGVIAFIMAQQRARKRRYLTAVAAIPEFDPVIKEMLADTGMGLALDLERSKLAIIDKYGQSSVLNFKDILAVEVCVNGETVTARKRGGQGAGATVSTLLLGPVGLLLGGLTGTKRRSRKISRMSLKIHTNDLVEPMREVVFLEGVPVKIDGLVYPLWARRLNEWYRRLHVIVEL